MDSIMILFWDWSNGLDGTYHNLPAPLCLTKEMKQESLEHDVTKGERKKRQFLPLISGMLPGYISLELTG